MLQTLVLGLVDGSIYALIAVGITAVYKTSRVLNFAQAEIGTFAIYTAVWVSTEHHQPWILGALAALAVAVVIGLAFEGLIVRRMLTASRVTVSVATVGLLGALAGTEAERFGPNPRELPPPLAHGGFTLAGVVVSPAQELALIVVAMVALALAAFFRYTPFGLAVLASADDPVAARLMGVPRWKVSSFTWGTAGALSAIAVLLIEPTVTVVAPSSFQGLFVFGLTASLLGGLTSLPGAFVGGLAVGIAQAEVNAHLHLSKLPAVQSLAMLVIVLGVLLLRPQGLLGKAA